MKRRSVWLWAWSVVIAGGAAAAVAQPAVSPEDEALNTLRAGIPRESDNIIVDRWVQAELTKLRGALSNEILIPGALKEFRDRFDAQYNHPDNTPEFRKKFAERVGATFANEYRKGQELNPVVANAMARQLLRMQDLDTREALYVGMASNDQVVRYLSGQALVKLQPQIAGDPQLTAQALQQISQAAQSVVNGVVAASLYQAAALPGREAEAVPVILEIMDARLASMRKNEGELTRGEVPAIAYLDQADQSGKLDQNLRAQAVARLAPLLRIHTERFGAQGVGEEERAAIAETISLTESLLKRITRPDPAPDVAGKMQGDDPNAPINMQIELIQWIGGPETQGVVNKAPWSVPAGAP